MRPRPTIFDLLAVLAPLALGSAGLAHITPATADAAAEGGCRAASMAGFAPRRSCETAVQAADRGPAGGRP